MQFKNLALLTLAGTTAAEFVIITSTPLPTALSDLTNIASYASSLQNYVETKLSSLSADPSAASAAVSAHRGLESFAATATQFSIPSDVTKVGALETFGSTPAWYSALPSDVKSYYDGYNAAVQSALIEAVGGNATTTKGGEASGTGAAAASGTNAAVGEKVVKIVGAGVAAAFAGVMAL